MPLKDIKIGQVWRLNELGWEKWFHKKAFSPKVEMGTVIEISESWVTETDDNFATITLADWTERTKLKIVSDNLLYYYELTPLKPTPVKVDGFYINGKTFVECSPMKFQQVIVEGE